MGAKKGQFAGDKNPSWRGGHAGYRGPNWKEQRQKAIERDNNRCQFCGISEGLTVNHVIPFRMFGDYRTANDLSNLLTLCRPCHTIEDNVFWQKFPIFFTSKRFPDIRLVKPCAVCGKEFYASSRGMYCQECKSRKCIVCGAEFKANKRLSAKYCSKDCRNKMVGSQSKYARTCIQCGKKVKWGSLRCHDCYLTSPALEVRPGRRPGRRPKGLSVAA